MSETLEDRVALVTGGGRGIGRAICLGLAEPGARVAVLARSADQVRQTALGPSPEIDANQWAFAIAVNVTAAARLSFMVLPGMLAQGWGRIVNVSSGIAASPAAMLRANAYATSKAALEAHTLNLAAELVGTGITANVFRPGSVDTGMQAWIRDQDPSRSAPPCTSGSSTTTSRARSSPPVSRPPRC